jgi:Cys-tRNA(Pro)/Cys-tRNA(Cys) deacylase
VTAQDYKTIYISAGRRGLEIEITATDLSFLTQAKFVALGNKK